MNILQINASSNKKTSTSEAFATNVLSQLQKLNKDTNVKKIHTTYANLPFVNDVMLGGFFAKEQTSEQIEALQTSQHLVDDLKWADTIIIATPIYNFSVPASLKAYFDLVARAGLTFSYTENGPVGLLKNKKVYAVVSSGGTQIGSDVDFAGRYIEHFLNFIGITDIKMIKLDQLMFEAESKQQIAKQQIAAIV